MTLNHTEIARLKRHVGALRAARDILDRNVNAEFNQDDDAYKYLMHHLDTKIDLAEQAYDLWASGAIS